MASDDRIDEAELPARGGDDTPPLFNKVPEPPPSHWGSRTSGSRFESEAYLRFFYAKKQNKEAQRDG
jgi:hypothetical protein